MGFPADVHSSSVLGDIGDTVFTRDIEAKFCGLHIDAQVCPHTEKEKSTALQIGAQAQHKQEKSFANWCTSTEPFVHPSIPRAAPAFLRETQTTFLAAAANACI